MLLRHPQPHKEVTHLEDEHGHRERVAHRDQRQHGLPSDLGQARRRPRRVDGQASEGSREDHPKHSAHHVHADDVERVVVAQAILHPQRD